MKQTNNPLNEQRRAEALGKFQESFMKNRHSACGLFTFKARVKTTT